MLYILHYGESIIQIYENIDNALLFILQQIKSTKYKFEIHVFDNYLQINKYVFNNDTYELIDIDDNVYISQNKYINSLIPKEEFNVKLNISSPKYNTESLTKKLLLLKNTFEQEHEIALELKQNYQSIEQDFYGTKYKINSLKLQQNIEKEKQEELKRRFDVDKDLFFIIKDELATNKIKEIPLLFIHTYKLFLNLEAQNIILTNEGFNQYVKNQEDSESEKSESCSNSSEKFI